MGQPNVSCVVESNVLLWKSIRICACIWRRDKSIIGTIACAYQRWPLLPALFPCKGHCRNFCTFHWTTAMILRSLTLLHILERLHVCVFEWCFTEKIVNRMDLPKWHSPGIYCHWSMDRSIFPACVCAEIGTIFSCSRYVLLIVYCGIHVHFNVSNAYMLNHSMCLWVTPVIHHTGKLNIISRREGALSMLSTICKTEHAWWFFYHNNWISFVASQSLIILSLHLHGKH